MNLFDKFLDKMMEIRERREEKRKQRELIKTEDDNRIVEALPEDKDNSGIDIKEVVRSMEDPESKAEVVRNNLEEIIRQNNVRDTMEHLNDRDVVEILEENKEELEKQGKVFPAIQAIDGSAPKLEAVEHNLEALTGAETATILNSVQTSKGKKEMKIENKKIKVASEQILRMLVNYGHVSQLDIYNMAASLEEESSKLAVVKLCLAEIAKYSVSKKKNITAGAKTKMIYDLLKITQVSEKEKKLFLDNMQKDGFLSLEEISGLEKYSIEERERQEQKDKLAEAKKIAADSEKKRGDRE